MASAHGMADIGRRVDIGRRADTGDKTLFKALSDSGNPTLDTVSKVLAAMGLRLTVEAMPA